MTAVEEPEPSGYRRFDTIGVDPSRVSEAVEAARSAVEAGECIVLPTDTVYGIAADAFSSDAVQRLLDAKARGRDMPPPVLVADASLLRVLAVDVPQTARDLVERHWPGPLTVISRAQPSLTMDLGETAGTIALRVPDHDLAREVLRATGPLAVSSANISGLPAAMTCDEAVDQLGIGVAVYLDGGWLGSADALPSTIVDFSRTADGELLRAGALPVEVLRETCPDLVDLTEEDPEPWVAMATPDDAVEDTDFGDDEPEGDDAVGDDELGDDELEPAAVAHDELELDAEPAVAAGAHVLELDPSGTESRDVADGPPADDRPDEAPHPRPEA